MFAVRFALQNAFTTEQVLSHLGSFIDHLHRYRIEEILPEQLARLSARDADDVHAWAQSLRKGVHDRYCLTAAGRLWFEEICDTYFAADRRLDELAAVRGPVHVRPASVTKEASAPSI